jgi:hypothetical protein
MYYLPPSIFFAFFKPRSVLRANSLIAKVQDFRHCDSQFSDVGAGSAAGKVVYQRDWLRRIRSIPLGEVVNKAIRAAASDAGAA